MSRIEHLGWVLVWGAQPCVASRRTLIQPCWTVAAGAARKLWAV